MYENGKQIVSYEYDKLNCLVRENNKKRNETKLFAYDNNGNILLKEEYDYTVKAANELGTAKKINEYCYKEYSDQLLSIIKNTLQSDGNYDNGWINFMQARLEVAYKLLSKNGVMFIHIDENELLSLTMLCGKIFGVKNILTMVWKKTNERFDQNRKEKPLESGVRRTHEYVLLCFKDRANTILNPIKQPV